MRLRFVGILAVLALMSTFMVSAVSADTIYADVTGYAEGTANNNHAATWGPNCSKIDSVEGSLGSTYLLPPLAPGLAYDLVIVKAGSDVSTDGHANTLFDNPSAGETVWADTNGNGVYDAEKVGDLEADKGISHIIVCTTAATPTITLDKVTVNGDSEFNFTLGGAALPDTLSGADPTVQLATAAGTYTIAEALTAAQVAAGWSLTSIVCSGNAAPAVVSGSSVAVTVGANEDVTCTFTNTLTPNTPTLILDKVTVNGDSEFNFTLGGAALPDTLSGADPTVQLATAAGTYTIAEALTAAQVAARWSLTSIVCSGNAAPAVVSGSSVAVTVGANEDVICTFTNTISGSGTLGGNPTPSPTPVVRQATQASVPNTAMELPAGGLSVALLALISLMSLGYVARRNVIGNRNRR